MNQNAPDDGAYDRPEDNMSLRDYEDKLNKRLRILAVVYVALLAAVQAATILISVRYERLSTDLLYTGDLTGLRAALMVLSPLSSYIRLGTLLWVTFYYGKKNSLTVLIISVGSMILSAGMEASPDRTSEIYFNYQWNTHLIEYGIRFASALGVMIVLWLASAALGERYRKHRHRHRRLPVMKTYMYAAIACLTVDLLFQFYFFLAAAGKAPDAPTALDWIYPFIKAGCGFLLCCGIGMLLTSIRRKYRAKDSAAAEKKHLKR